MKEEPVIRPATMADILAVDALRKAESDALGFVPIQTYEDVTKGLHPSERVWIVEYNKQMAGFAYIGGGGHSPVSPSTRPHRPISVPTTRLRRP